LREQSQTLMGVQYFSLNIVTCQKLENSKSSLKQDYSAPSMGGVVATISFDVANHGCPLDSSIRENCFAICYTSSARRRNLLLSQSSPTNHVSKVLIGAGVLSALRPFEPRPGSSGSVNPHCNHSKTIHSLISQPRRVVLFVPKRNFHPPEIKGTSSLPPPPAP
jgi:hypothetical protein